MINLTPPGDVEELVCEVLGGAKGFTHFDVIVQRVRDSAAVRTHEVLDDLRSDGVVGCDVSGNRWRLNDRR